MEFTSFKAMADAAAADLGREARQHLPAAAITALTKTSIIARDALKADMRRIFKSPTPYALNASRAIFATRQTMSSAVLLKDTGGGTPAENYLGPEIEGGPRGAKRSEKALRAAGILPAGRFVVPGRAATLDRYGNQTAAEIVAILGAVSAFKSGGVVAKAVTRRALAKRRKRQAKFFVAHSKRAGGREPIGIYKVVASGKVAPVMIFTTTPHYRARFDFYGLAQAHAEAAFIPALDAALSA